MGDTIAAGGVSVLLFIVLLVVGGDSFVVDCGVVAGIESL